MKKLLNIMLCLFLLTGVAVRNVEAEGDYPDLENVKIDALGTVTWDPYPGADYYNVFFPYGDPNEVVSSVRVNSFDFKYELGINGRRTGVYRAMITALSDTGVTLATSVTPEYQYVSEYPECPPPKNVRWDGNLVRWDPAGNLGYGYEVHVYEEGTDGYNWGGSTSENFMDVSNALCYQDKQYYATVTTYMYEHASSEPVATGSRPGRFTIRDILLTLDGETAEFKNAGGTGAFTDDEGNPPAKYYLTIYGGGMNWGGQILHSPFNVKDAIIQAEGETGHYEIRGYAMTEYWYRLSNDSNPITYDFVKPGNYIHVQLQGSGAFESDEIIAIEGQPIERPADPIPYYQNEYFAGWFTDPEWTIPYDFSKPVTEPFILYAAFEQKKNGIGAVAFPAEGGTVSADGSPFAATAGPVYKTPGNVVELEAKPNDGYTFTGWHVDSPDGELYDTSLTTWPYTYSDQTFYAVFKKGYEVRYGYAGSPGAPEPLYVEKGTVITLEENMLEAPLGYTFAYWGIYSADDWSCIATELHPGDTFKVEEGINIIPTWSVIGGNVTRLSGKLRYDTSIRVAEELKKTLYSDKFDAVVLATGEKFADALGGGFLATRFPAPILLTKPSQAAKVNKFINENLMPGGIVYILGGTGAVPEECLEGLSSTFSIRRLSGKTRYDTNLAILKEMNVLGGELLICSGENYADALAASAVGIPMMLVNPKKKTLTEEQKTFLTSASYSKIYIIGGTGAVPVEIENEVKAYGETERLSGKGRYETSVAIAETFFNYYYSERVILAYSHDYPDGLCAGPLGYALYAPIILTRNGNETPAQQYCSNHGITSGYVTGGTGRIPDDTAKYIFNVTEIK